ncbi:MAG: MerR family transcriptional regulator [Parafilimonas sp.]
MNQLDLFNVAAYRKNEYTADIAFAAEPNEETLNIKIISEMKEDISANKSFNTEFEAEEKTASSVSALPHSQKKVAATANGRGRKSYMEMDAEAHLVEVPDDEILFQKKYYSISEVAHWFHVKNSLIRFWENEFDILKPRKNRKGDRLFRPEDIKNLQLIYYLLRQRKFSIEGARQYLKDNPKKAEINMQLINSLTKLRSFLLELRATLEE